MSIRRVLAACAGLLLLQLAWITVIPAFGGIDEFDHSYRAAAVARGEWAPPPTDATRGTGAWVHVPADIVRAARPECKVLTYTTDADCVGIRTGSTVRIASGAGRYHPLFYALIGWPALPFDGTGALYVMRAANAVLCTGLFLLGLLALRRWARTTWPFVGAVAACTPVLIYSSTIASPNGFEMMAAFAFWASVLGLLRTGAHAPRPARGLLAIAAVSGCLLVTVRSLGPVWCVLIALTCLLATPGSIARLRTLLRVPAFLAACAAVGLAALASVIWIETQQALVVGSEPTRAVTLAQKLDTTSGFLPLWLFQSVAAFPFRDQPSPPVVYAAVLAVLGTLLVLAWRRGTGRSRLTLGVVVLVSAGVPFCISLATMAEHAGAWQGRYGLPYSLGLALVAGLALEHRGQGPAPRLVAVAVGLTALATVAAQLRVLAIEREISPSYASGAWHPPPALVLATLALVGAGLLWSVALPSQRRHKTPLEPSEQQGHLALSAVQDH